MPINVTPSSLARKLTPKKTVEKLVKKDLTVNRAAVTMLAKSGLLAKKKLEEVAIKVIKSYKETFKQEKKDGASVSVALDEALNDKKLMVQRVQDTATREITKEVKKVYRGERYEWLPSLSDEPDPLHQLNYGKRFWLGKGEAPGDRWGCKCGMRILVDENELFLNDDISA
jgi:uncharacterized protein YyaL (SSP411 family)